MLTPPHTAAPAQGLERGILTLSWHSPRLRGTGNAPEEASARPLLKSFPENLPGTREQLKGYPPEKLMSRWRNKITTEIKEEGDRHHKTVQPRCTGRFKGSSEGIWGALGNDVAFILGLERWAGKRQGQG